MQIEYENEVERRAALRRLIGIEDRVYLQVEGEAPVYAIADEDLDRETDEKTSAVHFLRFELEPPMKQRLLDGARLFVGCDHPGYRCALEEIDPRVRASLVEDLREL
jgi:hypothetical protein